MFSALGVPAHLGRVRRDSDDRVGATPVIVLGYDLFRTRFGTEADVVGTTVPVDGRSYTIVGVMPEGFAFPRESTRFWIGLGDDELVEETRNAGWLHAVARLAPGVTLEAARREMTVITERLGERYPVEGRFIATVHGSRDVWVAAARRGLVLLFGASLLVLLVACANITGLFIARVTERRRELTVHAALGAGTRTLAGIVVSESLVLSLAGGLLGIVFAYAGLGEFVRLFPEAVPRATEVGINPVVLAACLAGTIAVGMVLGWAPAAQSRRLDVNAVLRDGGHGTTAGRSVNRLRGLLILGEVALAVVLLATTGLFAQSHIRTGHRPRGFDEADLLLTSVSVPEDRRASPSGSSLFFGDLEERLRAVPGVIEVASASQMPYQGGYSSPPATVDLDAGNELFALHTSAVTPGYFNAMSIPLLAGRGFTPGDAAGSAPVTVVSRALADRYWPEADPLGRRIRLEVEDPPRWYEVVGLVGSIRYGYTSPEAVEYYRPMAQDPSWYRGIVIKAAPGRSDAVAAQAERIIRSAEPRLPVAVRAMASHMADDPAFRASRAGTAVMTLLAGVATLLSILGVYSVLAYGVLRRRREIGIRTSLGGRPVDVLLPVLRSALSMTAIGLALGLIASVWVASALRSSLTEVSTVNPVVLVGVVATIGATTIVAATVPSLRALHVDPLIAFKAD